jgi:polysaccharide biosynthesis/export protein
MKHLLVVGGALMLTLGGHGLAAQRPSDYTVGPRDILQITTLEEPSMTGRFPVDSDGSISFPHLNRVKVGGLTPGAIEAKLKQELERRQIFNPGRVQISVDVAEFRSRSVFVMGAVKAPNEYRLVGDMTLIAALAQAGGTLAGASNDISIIRPRSGQSQAPLSPDTAQDADIRLVKLSDLQNGVMTENITLRDGDTIWVPAAERFFVTGMVKNVGAYVFERGLTVQQALALAGGITELGSDRRINIERMDGDRKRKIKAKLTDLIQPNDTIDVGRRRF